MTIMLLNYNDGNLLCLMQKETANQEKEKRRERERERRRNDKRERGSIISIKPNVIINSHMFTLME